MKRRYATFKAESRNNPSFGVLKYLNTHMTKIIFDELLMLMNCLSWSQSFYCNIVNSA